VIKEQWFISLSFLPTAAAPWSFSEKTGALTSLLSKETFVSLAPVLLFLKEPISQIAVPRKILGTAGKKNASSLSPLRINEALFIP